MKFGVYIFATDYTMPVTDLARELEARGFESLWLPEHTHIPASRKTPYPAGGDLPKEYWHTLDPFVALGAAAAVTERLLLATGICLLIERDTITTAKAVASLDRISNGRVLFGIGGGWNVEEMENHGTVFKTRFKRLREQVLAMKAIWTEEEAEFHGDFVNFDPIWAHPKPVQKPHPPVILGGLSSWTLDRVADYCDGWLPIDLGPDAILPLVNDLRARAEKRGRSPESVSVSLFGTAAKADVLARYRDAGIDRVIFPLRPEGAETTLPRLDRLAGLMK